jgi:hypothetical protein
MGTMNNSQNDSLTLKTVSWGGVQYIYNIRFVEELILRFCEL